MDRVENRVAIREITHYDRFLLSFHCFQISSAAEASTCVCSEGMGLLFPTYNKAATDNFENIYAKAGKIAIYERTIIDKVENIEANGEIALHWPFSSFATMFLKVVCCEGVRKCLYVGKG